MDELNRVAPRGKLVPGKQVLRQWVGKDAPKILQRRVDDPPHDSRGDAADGFVDRHDAANFGGVRFPVAKEFVLRIDHLDPAWAVWIEVCFSVKDDPLPFLEFPLEIEAMKKLAGQRAGIVADEQVIHAAARACITYQAAARDLRLHGVDLSRRDLADFREPDAVLIAEREIPEQIFKCADAALREQFGAARSHTFEIHHFGRGRNEHRLFRRSPSRARTRSLYHRKTADEWRLSLGRNVPSPSQKAWDGEASTKPSYLGGSCSCRGRPVLGRASACPL